MASKEIPLNWDVFVAKRRGLTRDLPPGKEQLNWVGGSATLIYGGSDAVLVDTLLTIDQNRALADWIGARRKNLTTIYVTHGHGEDRKSTRLNSSHDQISYAVFCLKKKTHAQTSALPSCMIH